jgi:WD40 repeat protein
VLPSDGIGPSAERVALRVEKVFEFKPPDWKRNDWAYAVFGSGDEVIHFIHGPMVRIVDWKTGREVKAVSYVYLPVVSKFTAHVSGWDPVPDSDLILMTYSSSLYAVAKSSLQVKQQLINDEREQVAAVALSPDGEYAAIETISMQDKKLFFRLYAIDDWKVVLELPIDTREFIFTPDGKYIALSLRVANQDKWVTKCGLQMREVPSGRVASEWWVEASSNDCPRPAAFVPGRAYVLAGSDWGVITLWDTRTGEVIQRIADQGRRISSVFIFPDGSRLVGKVHDDPQDTPDYEQEFKIWDLDSSGVVYESPKSRWPFLSKFRDWTDLEMALSSDGQYLLVTRHPSLRLYRISESETTHGLAKD